MKRIAAAAILALAALPAQAFDITAMSPDEREAFRQEIRDYLLANPEVIMEAVNMLEERQAQEQADLDDELVATNAEDIFRDGYSWVGGNPEGDITVVEFLDYRCGYCRRAYEDVNELIASDGNIRFVVKEFPILGPDSLESARFAIAVKQLAGDDAYEAVHDALMQFKGEVTKPALRRIAGTYGLDADAVIERMDSDAVTEVIADTRALAQRLQITGTPTFVMQGQLMRGYAPLETMRAIVEEERAEG